MSRVSVVRWACLGLLGVLGACGEVLDLQEARLDPTLGAAGAAGGDGVAPSPGAAGAGALRDAGADESDGGGESDGGADPDAGTPCERLCSTVLAACPDRASEDAVSYAVYDSRFTCLEQCTRLPLGEPDDQTGNSVYCRLNNAALAELLPGERASACPAASAGGDGICGDNCEGYCVLMAQICPGSFTSAEACRRDCASVPDVGGFDIHDIEGNTLQCRLYHLAAATVSPINHCPHAAGAAPCVDAEFDDHLHE